MFLDCSGRFDIKSSAFHCTTCRATFEVRTEDYIVSGFWPGTADGNISYLICQELLAIWYHLQHQSLGISQNKFIQTMEEISEEADRVRLNNLTAKLLGFIVNSF